MSQEEAGGSTGKEVEDIPEELRKRWTKEIETCFGTSCNMCERDCPVYRVLRNRTLTSRAKNRAMLGTLMGHYPVGRAFAEAIYTCPLCGMCDARCALDNTERFLDIRRLLAREGLHTEEQRNTVDTIRSTGDVYGRGLDPRELFPEYVDGDVPVYIGCTYMGHESDVRQAFAVLEALGVRPKVDKEVCCGNVVDLMGFERDFREIREAFSGTWPHDKFLTVCPSCAHVFRKHYGLDASHMVEFVGRHLDEIRERATPLDIEVTYHDPCDLGRRLGVFDAPRKILEAIGATVVEMDLKREFSLCCGAGGGLLVYDNQLAEEIGMGRMGMAGDTGVDTLVTACPTCETQLTTCAMLARKDIGRRIRVESIWALVRKALEADR